MFAPKVVKAQAKTAPSSANSLARQRSKETLRLLAQPSRSVTGNEHGDEYEQEVDQAVRQGWGAAWDFSKIPLFPPDRASRPQAPSQIAAAPLPVAIQGKLVVGPVDDPLEHEADRVADLVVARPPQVSRKCAACEEEEAQTLRTKVAGSPEAAAGEAPGLVHQVLRSPGQPLDRATRQFFEPRFASFDFARVRIHADRDAAASAMAVNAAAYTVGNHIVFDDGQYAPGTVPGRLLLAHELTHVIQQGRNRAPNVLQRQDAAAQSTAPQTTPQLDGAQPMTGDPAQLRACLAACAEGGESLIAFCNSLPDPRLRAGCFALQFAGEVACSGWCYWHFGF